VIAVQLSTRREKIINIMKEILVSVLNGTSSQATSYGNRQADEIGGTVYRLAAKTSLQKVYNNQIQTPHELFNYYSNKQNIKFFYVQEEQILNYTTELSE
jgi:hypothetical protein